MTDLADLFPGYESKWINTSSGRVFARVGGSGPPLLCLHGFSSTHVMWHAVAPKLHVDRLLWGLAAFGLAVGVAENPLQCVALGTGRALEERKRLSNVLTSMY